MHIGEPLRTVVVEPLELPVDTLVVEGESDREPLERARDLETARAKV